MFDYHMHSRVSFDSREDPQAMLRRALEMGLREICFTDHQDYDPRGLVDGLAFSLDTYRQEYDRLAAPGLKIRRGVEFGMLPDNAGQLRQVAGEYPYDFVLGSVHFARGLDVYYTPYWETRTQYRAEADYLEDTLLCVQAHDDFDVLGHLTYISKSPINPTGQCLHYRDHAQVIDEILHVLAAKGKGLEVNTSGIDRCGDCFPTRDILLRFRQLGGQIVTVGSDAHDAGRVGQYCRDTCGLVQDIFGHVCTFAERKPIFHKI